MAAFNSSVLGFNRLSQCCQRLTLKSRTGRFGAHKINCKQAIPIWFTTKSKILPLLFYSLFMRLIFVVSYQWQKFNFYQATVYSFWWPRTWMNLISLAPFKASIIFCAFSAVIVLLVLCLTSDPSTYFWLNFLNNSLWPSLDITLSVIVSCDHKMC